MIYLVERKGETGYDEANSFVIRAKSNSEARKISVYII